MTTINDDDKVIEIQIRLKSYAKEIQQIIADYRGEIEERYESLIQSMHRTNAESLDTLDARIRAEARAEAAAEIAKLRAERDDWQTRAEQYETAWVNENAANCELTEEIAKLRAEREELQKRVDGFRDEFLEKALEWRGISFVDEACDKCGGSGVVAYGSTATWHGGIGGQAITSGVCDKCWGSGGKIHKGADLRKLSAALAEKA